MDVTLQTNQENAGLFGNTDSSAVIRDVGLLNVEVTGVSNVGGLVGWKMVVSSAIAMSPAPSREPAKILEGWLGRIMTARLAKATPQQM